MSEDDGTVVRLKRRVRRSCPICGEPAADGFRPFCSRRCADVDLGRWLGGHYRIPTDEGPGGEDEDGGLPRM